VTDLEALKAFKSAC